MSETGIRTDSNQPSPPTALAAYVKRLAIVLAVVSFFGYGVYGMFIRQTNEVGPLGFDKGVDRFSCRP